MVCDYDMPGMDGLEVLERVRAEHPSLPFVLLTGKGSETVASEAIRLGTTDYVPKPSGMREYEMLVNRIHNAISRFRRHREALREAERARSACDRLADAIVGLDSEWRYTFLDERAEDLLGQSEDELLGTTVWESLVEPEETEIEDSLQRAMREEEPRTIENVGGTQGELLRVRIHPGPDGVTLVVRTPGESDSRIASPARS